MGQLAPLMEEPMSEEDARASSKRSHFSWTRWVKNHLPAQFPLFSHKKPNLRILLSVIACPLSPVSVPLSQPSNVSSKAQYIIQQFRATAGTAKIEGAMNMKNLYASGTVALSMSSCEDQHAGLSILPSSSSSSGSQHRGSFVLWQMAPGMWLVELAVAGCQVMAGSDGTVAWRHTPWLGSHAAPGVGARPLRRALQGLDPVTVASIFSSAEYVGEKQINGDDDCFVLKLEADKPSLEARSDSSAEMIKHTMVGYFSQRSGLLVHLEDSQLTRVQPPGAPPTYWETNMASRVGDYRPVDGGVRVAHSGRSVANLVTFGEGMRSRREALSMEEVWTIDDVAFNVAGLSVDCFIPPQEIRKRRAGVMKKH